MAQLQPYCAIEGNDDGLPVVFVHGMGVDHRSLMMLDKAFDGNDSIRRIYLDLPGFGRTPALPEHACGLPEMADWLQTAIDGLVGKAFLNTALAVVKIALYGTHVDIAAFLCYHLPLLHIADTIFRPNMWLHSPIPS